MDPIDLQMQAGFRRHMVLINPEQDHYVQQIIEQRQLGGKAFSLAVRQIIDEHRRLTQSSQPDQRRTEAQILKELGF